MKRFLRPALVLGVLLALGTAAPAYGGAWVMPVEGGSIALGYGASYGSVIHRGVDIASSPGATVRAPAGGQVVFAGRVPADGGGTCAAVTIALDDGSRLSLLPLAELAVAQGARVEPADALGTVAATGDDSVAEPHLHLGLRSGDAYLDPTGLLPPAVVEPPVPSPGASTGAASDVTDAGDPPIVPHVSAAPAPVRPASAATAATRAPAVAPATPVAPASEVAHAVGLTHRVPEGADVPGASQVIVAASDAASWSWQRRTLVEPPPTSAVAWAAPVMLLLLAGALGLTRQLAHGRVH